MIYRKLVMLTLMFFGLGTSACSALPEGEIVTEVLLPAPPAQVWSVLTDGAAYPEWNPFMVEMKGEFAVGNRLRVVMQPEADQQMVFKPKLLVVSPGQELRWIGRLFVPGLFDGEHYFLLQEEDGATRLTHGEKFSGLALWFIDTDTFKANFEDMNAALAERLSSPAAP